MNDVIIIGGGIGGLVAAVALQQVGIRADVYEQASELREVGAGFTIWSNAIKALRRIGLDEMTVAAGSVLRRIHTLSPKGEVIDSEDMEPIYRSAGAPSVCIHRADLQRILADRLDPDRIHVGKELVGLERKEKTVLLRFADGTEEEGKIVIGADGIHSVVRRELFGPEDPRYSGYYCYRALTGADLPEEEAIFGMQPGAQLGFFPFGRKGEVYWFICPNDAERKLSRSEIDHRKVLESTATHLPPHLAEIILRTPIEDLIIGEAFDRPPQKEWGRGPVTLLGDAIHPTTPNLGQGACMAIEDGILLADELRQHGDRVAGLRAYEAKRKKRTAMITRASQRVGRIYQSENPIIINLRTLMFRSPAAGWIGRSVQRKLLEYEVPELG